MHDPEQELRYIILMIMGALILFMGVLYSAVVLWQRQKITLCETQGTALECHSLYSTINV